MALIKTQVGAWLDPEMVVVIDALGGPNPEKIDALATYYAKPHHVGALLRVGMCLCGTFDNPDDAQRYADELAAVVNAAAKPSLDSLFRR